MLSDARSLIAHHLNGARYWYGLYALSLAIRLAVLLPEINAPLEYPDYDGVGYYSQASELAATSHPLWDDRWHSYGGWSRGPLYFAFLAFWMRVAGVSVVGIRVMQAVLGAFCPLLLAALTRQLFGPAAGRIAGWLAAFLADLYFLPVQIMTENLYVFLVLLGLFLLARASSGEGTQSAFSAGLSFGLANLVRSAPQYCLPLLCLWLVRSLRRRRVALACAMAAGFFVAVMPWVVRNSLLYQRFFWIDNIGQFGILWPHPKWEALVRNQLPAEMQGDPLPLIDIRRNPVKFPMAQYVEERLGEAAVHPSAIASWFFLSFRHHNLKAIWWPPADSPGLSLVRWIGSVVGDLLYVFILFTAAIGVGQIRRWNQLLPLIWIFGNMVPAGLVMWIARRYAIPYSVLLVPLAAATIAARRDAVTSVGRRWVAIACLGFMMFQDLPLLGREYSSLPALRAPVLWWTARANGLSMTEAYAIDSGARIALADGRGVLEVGRSEGELATPSWESVATGQAGSPRSRKSPPGGGRVVFRLEPLPRLATTLVLELRADQHVPVRPTLNGQRLRALAAMDESRVFRIPVERDVWKSINVLALGPADPNDHQSRVELGKVRIIEGGARERPSRRRAPDQ